MWNKKTCRSVQNILAINAFIIMIEFLIKCLETIFMILLYYAHKYFLI